MKKILFSLLSLLIVSPAWAGDFVQTDPSDSTKFVSYVRSVDPSKAPASSTEVPLESIEPQRALTGSLPKKYLKVVSGLAAEMTGLEKSKVDSDLALEVKNFEISRIDAGNVTGKEVLLALDDLANDTAIINLRSELTSPKLKARIKKVNGL